MPVQLVSSDVLLVDSQVISQQGPEFFLLESGTLVLVVGEEDRLEVLVDDLLDVEVLGHWDQDMFII